MSRQDLTDRRKRMADAVAAGETLSSVARANSVSIETVRNACREHDVPASIRQPPSPATDTVSAT